MEWWKKWQKSWGNKEVVWWVYWNDIHTCFNLFCSMQTQSGSMSRRASLQVPGQKLLIFLAVQLYCRVQFLPYFVIRWPISVVDVFTPSGLLLSAYQKPCQVRGVREYSAFVFSFPGLSVDDGQFSFMGEAFYSLSLLLNYIPSCIGWD